MNDAEPLPSGPEGRRRLALVLLARAKTDPGLPGPSAALQRVCRAATGLLALQGAAVHVMGKTDGTGVAAWSDPGSRDVAELQFTTNEGPAAVAFRTQRPVLVPALDKALDRWPGFVSLAVERGVRGLFAFPLQEGAVSLGVLELYADRIGSLDADGQAMAAVFARLATEVMLDGGSVTAAGELGAGLSASFVDRARIHQAQGMVMVDLEITLADALSRMRARAFATETTLLEIADQVIGGFLTAEAWIGGDRAPEGGAT